MGFGEVCVKKPSCRCFSLKSSVQAREGVLRIRIATSEEQLELSSCFCRVWIEEKAVQCGKGHLKFTYRFQSRHHTSPLTIRVLRIVPTHEKRTPTKDSIDCRIYVTQRDFHTLQEINNGFLSKVERLLLDVQQHGAFASTADLIQQRLEEHSLAIFPDSEGFVLFREDDSSIRPQHALLGIRPTTLELTMPHQRFLLPPFVPEKVPVNTLQEALTEFRQSNNWPLVRKGQFGVNWKGDKTRSHQTSVGWSADDARARDLDAYFIENTVKTTKTQHERYRQLSNPSYKTVVDRFSEATQWKVDSVKSLVREAARISLHENVHVYYAIEKATLSILSHSDVASRAFVQATLGMIRTQGSDALGTYKLLAATLDIPFVKKAILQFDVLSALQEQYELMTQMIARSSASDSNESQCSFHEAHMEINNMRCFTYTEASTSGFALGSSPPVPRRSFASEGGQSPLAKPQISTCQMRRTETAGTTLSALSVDLVDAVAEQSRAQTPVTASGSPDPELRQDVPKLTFYWLTHQDGIRATTSGTTHTSISLPDGRSILFDEDLPGSEAAHLGRRGLKHEYPNALTSTEGSFSANSLVSRTVTEVTLFSWGVPLDVEMAEDADIPVAFIIKCQILEIMCAFSPLNLAPSLREEYGATRDVQLLYGSQEDTEDLQHPNVLAVLELLAPHWQVFPGEQPSIRWGPVDRGTQVALALVHEFACRPLNEVALPNSTLLNTRLFIPQDLDTESYLCLLSGSKNRLAQMFQFPRIDSGTLEEVTAVIWLLGEFVASSPSSSQARLAAYAFVDTFFPLETRIFKAQDTSHWPVPVFRLFHALLRLFRCMLERAADEVLEESLTDSLLKRDLWVKLVREYSRVVLFSEKLERRCEPEELRSLRLGVWSYHAALVKVIRAHRRPAPQEQRENLPEDFQDVRPPSFGQDPLDFLRYLISPGEGLAPRSLRRRDWEVPDVNATVQCEIQAQVLVCLKLLFSIPNNIFLKQIDISTFYLDLHWKEFQRSYLLAGSGRNYPASVVCKRHLEVIRVLMGHHQVQIFARVAKLGIMDCLADELALETANISTLGSFDPPPSRLKRSSDDLAESELHFGQASTSKTRRQIRSELSTTDSEFLSSTELISSEGVNTCATTQSAIASSKGSQEPWTTVLAQTIGLGHEVPRRQGAAFDLYTQESDSLRLRPAAERKLQSEGIPSRIPQLGQRSSPDAAAQRSSSLFSFPKRWNKKGSSLSFVNTPFETRIPSPPPFIADPTPLPHTEGRNRGRPLSAFGRLFKQRPVSLRLSSESRRSWSRAFGRERQTPQGRSPPNKIKTKPSKSCLPGLSPPAELLPLTKTPPANRRSSADMVRLEKNLQSYDTSKNRTCVLKPLDRILGRKPRDGRMSATISYSPSGLLATPLSVDSDFVRQDAGGKSLRSAQGARNVPLLNLTRLNSAAKKSATGRHSGLLSESSLSGRAKTPQLEAENNKPPGLTSGTESEACVTPSLNVPSGSGPVEDRRSGANQSFDESGDSQGPPTFSIYCGARMDKRSEILTSPRDEAQSQPIASQESPLRSRFQTPTDFQYTGDVAEDCRRLEMLERELRGPEGLSDLSTDDSDFDDLIFDARQGERSLTVPLLRIGKRFEQGENPPRVVPTPSSNAVSQSPHKTWVSKSNLSALSGFKTPSDFEYTGDLDEDVKRLEKLERMYHGEGSVSDSTSDSDRLDGIGLCQSPAFDTSPVPKLNFLGTERGLGSPPTSSQIRIETERSMSPAPGDEMSSFSWMHLSAKDSVSESEFSALLNGSNQSPATYLSPYEAARAERHVYSDVALRSVWIELLLEGMLLEYNTRPARYHDTHLTHIERMIKYVPRVLLHHLEHPSSKAVILQLKTRLGLQSPNLHRLLRLLTSSLFSVELYPKKDHIARGTFAHVFRCPLPLEGGPETCALKVMDHPIGQNEMSTLMDSYSEISIMEQFREEPGISHLYDYGIAAGSVFVVMKDYKCSLLDWRKRFPEKCPRALRLFLRIFRSIIDSVKVLHDRNVVHFDLKCSNILLEPLPGVCEEHFWNPPTEEPPFRVVLADFGEARSYSNNCEARTVRNHGTEFNKSPEMLLIAKAQKTDCPEYDRRKPIGAGPPSDVWALGCLLFELVTGEFLQFDTDWCRFFLRVTTNTMSIVDSEKQRLLGAAEKKVVRELLEFILVRRHLWRPNLVSLGQKLDSVMSSEDLPPYHLPTAIATHPQPPQHKVRRLAALQLLGSVVLPRTEVISFSASLKVAHEECLINPRILTENKISLIVCIAGTGSTRHVLRSSAARANVELLEISLGDEESISEGHIDIILNGVSHARCVCFTCDEGFESDTYELILKTLHRQHPSSSIFEHVMNVQRSLKTF